MKKQTIVTILFFILIFLFFIVFINYSKNYRNYILVPDSVHHHGGEQHIASDLMNNRGEQQIKGEKEVRSTEYGVRGEEKEVRSTEYGVSGEEENAKTKVRGNKNTVNSEQLIVNSEEKPEEAEKEMNSEKKKTEQPHQQLDYIHLRILNHPWNNKKIIEMIFVQAIFFLLLSSLLFVKNFK